MVDGIESKTLTAKASDSFHTMSISVTPKADSNSEALTGNGKLALYC